MLYWLAKLLTPHYSGFNVFSYLTVRAIFAVITALALGLLLGPWMIEKLKFGRVGQVVRDDGPKTHFSKAGTPTMGGMLILIAIFVSTLLWADLSNRFVWVVLGVTFTFGLVGFLDDYLKLAKKNPKGLIARMDYSAAVTGGVPTAHYLLDHKDYDGIVMPQRRRALRRKPDGHPLPDPVFVAIDFTDIRFS